MLNQGKRLSKCKVQSISFESRRIVQCSLLMEWLALKSLNGLECDRYTSILHSIPFDIWIYFAQDFQPCEHISRIFPSLYRLSNAWKEHVCACDSRWLLHLFLAVCNKKNRRQCAVCYVDRIINSNALNWESERANERVRVCMSV